MTKHDLINEIQRQTGDENNHWSKANCEFALECVTNAIMKAVAEGEKVKILGFGNFESKETKERVCISPTTKSETLVPAHKRVSFKVGGNFADMVRGE